MSSTHTCNDPYVRKEPDVSRKNDRDKPLKLFNPVALNISTRQQQALNEVDKKQITNKGAWDIEGSFVILKEC